MLCLHVVTGFIQSVNYQGNVCEFSLEGYEALNSEAIVPTLYVYLNNASDTARIVYEIEENYAVSADTFFKPLNRPVNTDLCYIHFCGNGYKLYTDCAAV